MRVRHHTRGRIVAAAMLVVSATLSHGCVLDASASSDDTGNVLQGPSHNAYEETGLTGPVARLWELELPGPISGLAVGQGVVVAQVGGALHAVRLSDGRRLWATDTGTNNVSVFDVASMEGHLNGNAMVIAGETLVLGHHALPGLFGYDLRTGILKWVHQTPSTGPATTYYRGLVAVDGKVVATRTGGTTEAVDPGTGDLVWSADVGTSPTVWSASDGELLFTLDHPCDAVAVSVETGEEVWRVPARCPRDGVTQGRVWTVADGRVHTPEGEVRAADSGALLGEWQGEFAPVKASSRLLTLQDGQLVARDAALGVPLWTFEGDGQLSVAPLVLGQRVYVASRNGRVFQVDLQSGSGEQVHQLPHGFPQSSGSELIPMEARDGIVVVPAGPSLTALAAGPPSSVGPEPVAPPAQVWPTGQPAGSSANYLAGPTHNNVRSGAAVRSAPALVWQRRLDGQVTAPLITPNRVVVMVDPQDARSRVVAFARRSGRVAWSRRLPDLWQGSMVVVGDAVRVTTGGGQLWSIALDNGQFRWKRSASPDGIDEGLFRHPMTVFGSTTYVHGSLPLYAHDRRGAVAWAVPLEHGAAVAVNRRWVFNTAPDCLLSSLRRSDGAPRWLVDLGCAGDGDEGLAPVIHGGAVHDTDNLTGTTFRARDGLPLTVYSADREPAFWGNTRFALTGGMFQAVDTATQRIRWSRNEGFHLPPLVVGRRVYGSTVHGQVLQMSASTGRVQWSSDAGEDVPRLEPEFVVPPALAAAHGTLAVPQGRRLLVFG